MGGQTATHTSKDKKSGRSEEPSQTSMRRIAGGGPVADILDLQHAAGNRAVSELAQSSHTPSRGNDVPPVVRSVLNSGGQPLDPATRASMEARFGHDFGQVRVHTDTRAAESARAVDARAYTVGRDIVFSEGGYAPHICQGSKLLAHELAHVIQQERGGPSPPPLRGGKLEQDANAAASASVAGRGSIRVGGASAPGLARQPAPPVSLSDPPDPLSMSEDDLRAKLKEIHLWKAGQIATTAEVRGVEQIREVLQDELNHRNRQRALPKESGTKSRRGGKKSPQAQDPTAHVRAPRSASTSFNIADLSADEMADELQRMDEWFALASQKDSRKKTVEATQAAISTQLAGQESAPMFERHNLRVASKSGSRVVTTERSGLNRYEAIAELRLALRIGRLESDHASFVLDMLYDHRDSMPIRSRVSEFLGGASDPDRLVGMWSRGNTLLYSAGDALDAGNFTSAAQLHAEALDLFTRVDRGGREYFGDVVKGSERAVTGLEAVKTTSAVVVTVGTGGAAGVAVGGAYAGAQSFAQQASEVHFGLRDKIDWGDVAFDTVVGATSGYLGGKLGNMVVAKLMGNPAVASLGRKAVAYAVGDYVAGRAGSTIQLSTRSVYDLTRGRDVTWEQFLNRLADQITDPRQAATDIIMGHANRYVARSVDRSRSPRANDPAGQPPPPRGPAPQEPPVRTQMPAATEPVPGAVRLGSGEPRTPPATAPKVTPPTTTAPSSRGRPHKVRPPGGRAKYRRPPRSKRTREAGSLRGGKRTAVPQKRRGGGGGMNLPTPDRPGRPPAPPAARKITAAPAPPVVSKQTATPPKPVKVATSTKGPAAKDITKQRPLSPRKAFGDLKKELKATGPEGKGPVKGQRLGQGPAKQSAKQPHLPAPDPLANKIAKQRSDQAMKALDDVPKLKETVQRSRTRDPDGRYTLRRLAEDSPDQLRGYWEKWQEKRADGSIKTKSFGRYAVRRLAGERGLHGERTEAFVRGPDEITVKAPKGSSNLPGSDIVTHSTKTDRTKYIDNKAFRSGAKVSKVSAAEKNLAKNMADDIADIKKFANKGGVPREIKDTVLPRMGAAQKGVADYIAKNKPKNLYSPTVQKDLDVVLKKHKIDRVVTTSGGAEDVTITKGLEEKGFKQE